MATKRPIEPSMPSSCSKMRKVEDSKDSRVKVYVRVRPFNTRENALNHRNIIHILDNKSLIFDPEEPEEKFFFHGVAQTRRDVNKKVKKNMYFDFDAVFTPESTNYEVFETTASGLINSLFEGYNCSVFAYGATGAGKTYTMLGNQESPGITYLTLVKLLERVEACKQEHDITLAASYVEVYNEVVRDLLHPTGVPLQLREEGGGRVIISGLRAESITRTEELFTLLENGNQHRSQHPTDTNAESSRSHAIFQVHVWIQKKSDKQNKTVVKLSMIDLAGSEKGSATGCQGVRFKEGSNINKSLLALGNCINALADGLKHIPFRDSKLTRILKDCLGGNCHTLMIANVSPSSGSYEDIYNTLKYATRAKAIAYKANKNIISGNLSVHHYKKMIQDLREQVSFYEKKLTDNPDVTDWMHQVEKVMEERKRLHVELYNLSSQKKLAEWRLHRKMRNHLFHKSCSLLRVNTDRLNASIAQLKARCETIKNRIQEIMPAIEKTNAERQKLIETAKSSKHKLIYESIIDAWEMKVKEQEQTSCQQYFSKFHRLMKIELDTYEGAIDIIMPYLSECYGLLKAYKHITEPMKESYEYILKCLQGNKEVTWDEENKEDVFDEVNPAQNYFTDLVMSNSEIIVKEIEDLENYFTSLPVVKPKISTPLRPIQNSPGLNKAVKRLNQPSKVKSKLYISNQEIVTKVLNSALKKNYGDKALGRENNLNDTFSVNDKHTKHIGANKKVRRQIKVMPTPCRTFRAT